MVAAVLYIDFADPAWFPGQTLSIEIDPQEHVFRRAILGNEVRGVFANINGKTAMLLRKGSEAFACSAPGCAVSIVVSEDGIWPQSTDELGQLRLEDVGKAVLELVE